MLGSYIGVLANETRDNLEARATDADWVTEYFCGIYRRIVSANRPAPPVGLLIVSCERRAIDVAHVSEELLEPADLTIDSAAKQYWRGDKEVPTMVLGLYLPSEDVQIAAPGEVIKMGSGRQIDRELKTAIAIRIGGTAASLKARMNVIASGIAKGKSVYEDESYNSLVHAMTLDNQRFHAIGTASDMSLNRLPFQILIEDEEPIPVDTKDLRKDILMLQDHSSRRWVETYYESDRWWILDYVSRSKIPLRNALLDPGTSSRARLIRDPSATV